MVCEEGFENRDSQQRGLFGPTREGQQWASQQRSNVQGSDGLGRPMVWSRAWRLAPFASLWRIHGSHPLRQQAG